MNGRIYDPQLGRFLCADLVIDGPINLQGYNRYSYVQNNPLVNVDPSGYTIERRNLSPIEAAAGAGGFGPPMHPEILNSAIPKNALRGLFTFVTAYFAADQSNDIISNCDDPDVVGAPSTEAGGRAPYTGISENSTNTGADAIMPDSGSSPAESDLAGAEIETNLTDQIDVTGIPDPTVGDTTSSNAVNSTGSDGVANEFPDARHSQPKSDLVDMAKSDKKSGVTREDMKAYEELNAELPDPFPPNRVRTDEGHPGRGPHAEVPHGHVGPVDYIPITNP